MLLEHPEVPKIAFWYLLTLALGIVAIMHIWVLLFIVVCGMLLMSLLQLYVLKNIVGVVCSVK